jgi:hypothetical protein
LTEYPFHEILYPLKAGRQELLISGALNASSIRNDGTAGDRCLR